MARYNRIFAALDGADTQEAVIRRAFSIAHDNDAEVVLGHVIDSALFETGGVRGDQIAKTNEEAIRKELALFLTRAEQDEHVPSVDIQVRDADTQISLLRSGEPFSLAIPFTDRASVENALHCVALLCYLGYDPDTIARRCLRLTGQWIRLRLLRHNIGKSNCIPSRPLKAG